MNFPISLVVAIVLPGMSFGQDTAIISTGQSATENIKDVDPLELTPYQRISMYLGHSLFKAEPVKRQGEVLWGIKAVKPMLEIPEKLEAHFNRARLERKMISILQEKAIPLDREDGHLLLFRIRAIWDKNEVTVLYTYDLDLIDKVFLYRDGQIKSNIRSVWNISNLGYAGKDVFENAMLINVESAVERFAISYFEQLDYDIISDTPLSAQITYQKIRDGEENILELLANQQLPEQEGSPAIPNGTSSPLSPH